MKYILFSAFVLSVAFTSCTTTGTLTASMTRGTNYPKMYQEHPATLLIMPPINKTTHVEAKEYFYTSLAKPLCEKGFYVISPFLAMEMFKGESAYDSEMFLQGSLDPFRTLFGADAVLFTTINNWSKLAMGGTITVDIEYELKSTHTHESLFKRHGLLTIDTNVSSQAGGWADLLVNTIATAVNTALTDKMEAAHSCNTFVLKDLPEGKYSVLHGKDQSVAAGDADISATVTR